MRPSARRPSRRDPRRTFHRSPKRGFTLPSWFPSRKAQVGLLFFVFVGAVFAAMLKAPWLEVRTVRVHGTTALYADEVKAVKGVIQVRKHANLVGLHGAAMAQRIRALPFAGSVRVVKRLPNSIDIYVRPLDPVAVMMSDQKATELDRAGRAIRAWRDRPGLHEISVGYAVAFVPGKVVGDETVLACLDAALGPWQNRPPGPVRVAIAGDLEISLHMPDSVSVNLGRAEEMARKLDLLHTVYARDSRVASKVSVLDLRFPETPGVTPRGLEQGASAAPQ